MSLSAKLILVLILLVGGFLGGFIPLYQKNRGLETELSKVQAQLADTQQELQLAQLQGRLARVLIEVELNNFGNAQEHSTKFFDQLGQAVATVVDPPTRQRLAAVLERRDEITADLAALRPAVAAKLRSLCLQLP